MADKLQLFLERIDTPIGELLLVADRDKNLRAVDWTEYEPRMRRLLRLHYGEDGFTLEPATIPSNLAAAMKRYFAGLSACCVECPARYTPRCDRVLR
jgi:methylated-DNA-[protein]-cysteine S-methyltransferase